MVDLCKCYGKVQVLVLQVLSPSDPLSECIFDLMPFDVSALSSLPLGDLCGVSPARPLPFSDVPRPKVPGCPAGGEGTQPAGEGVCGFRCSHWPPMSARQPWRCCAPGQAHRAGSRAGLGAAFSVPTPVLSRAFLTATLRGGYSPLVLVTRKQSL